MQSIAPSGEPSLARATGVAGPIESKRQAQASKTRKQNRNHFSPAKEKSDPHTLGPTQGTRPQVVTPRDTSRYWILLHTRKRYGNNTDVNITRVSSNVHAA
jgi:hypothetical protein